MKEAKYVYKWYTFYKYLTQTFLPRPEIIFLMYNKRVTFGVNNFILEHVLWSLCELD